MSPASRWISKTEMIDTVIDSFKNDEHILKPTCRVWFQCGIFCLKHSCMSIHHGIAPLPSVQRMEQKSGMNKMCKIRSLHIDSVKQLIDKDLNQKITTSTKIKLHGMLIV